MTYGPMWLAGLLAPGIIRGRLSEVYGYDIIQTVGPDGIER
jgi:hypothetical protein